MARLLVLSGASESPIPALTLLPHSIVVAPMSPQSVANNGDADIIILDGVADLVAAIDPIWCEVTGAFGVRGGIGITVRAVHGKQPQP